MTIQISEYVNVKKRAEELNCNIPTGIALLPRNFETAESKDELIHESSVPTIRVLWRKEKISETKIEKEEDKFPNAQENAFEWIGPIIFVSASILSQNPYVLTVGLGVVSNYLTEWFKGIPGDKKVRLDIVIEQAEGKVYKRISYKGEPEGLHELPKIISEVQKYE